MGEPVRYDGRHKRNLYITETLSGIFDFVPICPEVAIGMGIPRAPIELVVWGKNDVRAMGVGNRRFDVTTALQEFSQVTAKKLNDISGYILKSGSPSCGKSVAIYTPEGKPIDDGAGIFARVLMETQPLLPAEQEDRLDNINIRRNFLVRIFAYHRWQTLEEKGLTVAKLVEFHSRYKSLIFSNSQQAYHRLEQLVLNAHNQPVSELSQTYGIEFMGALKEQGAKLAHREGL